MGAKKKEGKPVPRRKPSAGAKAPKKVTICGHNGNAPVVVPRGWDILQKGKTLLRSHRAAWTNAHPDFLPMGNLAGYPYGADTCDCGCLRMVAIYKVREVVKRRGK